MTQEQAEYLASHNHKFYRARKVQGRWCVWCDESDHHVEYSPADIARADKAIAAKNLAFNSKLWGV